MSKKSRERQKLRRRAERDGAGAEARSKWLEQFSALAVDELSANQRDTWTAIQKEFPEAKLGRRSGGRLSFYFLDSEGHGSAGELPAT